MAGDGASMKRYQYQNAVKFKAKYSKIKKKKLRISYGQQITLKKSQYKLYQFRYSRRHTKISCAKDGLFSYSLFIAVSNINNRLLFWPAQVVKQGVPVSYKCGTSNKRRALDLSGT